MSLGARAGKVDLAIGAREVASGAAATAVATVASGVGTAVIAEDSVIVETEDSAGSLARRVDAVEGMMAPEIAIETESRA